ncbi:upstream stimulatory factor isoform X1 [Strongylocentrotus purpuratus]|uniref:BHLH domain-containing protein n=1 Tax=Strongylocentrotus purpuratus TaxID=7668 RepID=A0A7M7HKA8_STRPU|nr:upstream stimulatory factor isoform X1 [Strongylocentrotus purpuratus]|eukprot:XP_011675774.1 PREDICTED: upstream stimulatory factor isoform X2 [Strongylocentrotus purpuratus]
MDVLDQTLDQGPQDKDKDLEEEVTVHLTADGDQVVQDPSGEGPFAENIQYQFRTDSNGQSQVTYRVVQVGDNETNPQAVVTTFPQGQQALTQVIQGSFNGESPTSESQGGETRFTYFPASAAIPGDGAGPASGGEQQPGITQPSGAAGGQFYVMMSPQDVLQGASQRTIAPRTHQFNTKIDNSRTVRDERRRATHNEVERRRRDKINNWIVKLSKIIPDCNIDHSKQGQVSSQESKGGILSKTCDYIHDLRNSNTRMAESLKDSERLTVDIDLMRQQLEELKGENALLRAQLQQAGIDPAGNSN